MKFWIVNKAATADAIIAAVEAGKCTSDWQVERIARQHGDKVMWCSMPMPTPEKQTLPQRPQTVDATKMYDMMKKQNFGVEIELTGITREQAANVIATYFGTQTRYLGTYYNTYGATDRKGRTWKAMSDGSIKIERKTGRGRILAGREYSCEVVTPSSSKIRKNVFQYSAPVTLLAQMGLLFYATGLK